MNILWLSTRSPYPLISGHSLRTYHTVRNASRKHNVFLVTFVQLPEELEERNIHHLKSFCRAVFPFRIPVDASRFRLASSALLNLFSPLPFVAQKYNVPSMRERIREILDKEKIDLVHVDLLPLGVYVDEFMDRTKVIADHNVEWIRLYRWYETERNPVKKAYLRQQWPKLREFERSCLDRFDSCIVVSETDRQALEGMGVATRFFVVPNGTDTEYFQPSAKEPLPETVLWLGHMDVHTNRDAVLYLWREIFPILRKKDPRLRMHFVGTAPPKEIVDAAKKDHRIVATGFVDDIRGYLAEASAVLVPMRIGGGTRLKILDAMAMGKAIVSTSVGCEGLEVRDGREICIADDAEVFAEKTISLLKNRRVRRALEINARKRALACDWRLMAEEQERAYEYAVTKMHSAEAEEAAGDPGIPHQERGVDRRVPLGSHKKHRGFG